MILNSKQIAEAAKHADLIRPFVFDQVQPASYDFRLGYHFGEVYTKRKVRESYGTTYHFREPYLDPAKAAEDLEVRERCLESYVLSPGKSVLAVSQEVWKFPDHLSGKVYTKSTVASLGIEVASAGGWFDPGFEGTARLFIRNNGPVAVLLRNGMKIGQMIFLTTWPLETTYDGNYSVSEGLEVDRWTKALVKIGSNIRTSEELEAALESVRAAY